MKIEQWVEQRYKMLDHSSNHDEQSLDGYAFVRLDKVMQEFERIGLNPFFLQYDNGIKYCIQHKSKRLIDLNFVLRSAVMTADTARDLLRKLIVWCAVYNEAV